MRQSVRTAPRPRDLVAREQQANAAGLVGVDLVTNEDERSSAGHSGRRERLSAAAFSCANTMCPALPDEPIDPAVFADRRGNRVFRCCNRCLRQFLEHPMKYLAILPQFAGNGTSAKGEPTPPPPPWRGVRLVGRFHPLAVHFPIAPLLCAALGECLAAATQRGTLALARLLLLATAVAAGVAGHLGGTLVFGPDWFAQ